MIAITTRSSTSVKPRERPARDAGWPGLLVLQSPETLRTADEVRFRAEVRKLSVAICRHISSFGPFHVFHNATIEQLAGRLPKTMAELEAIKGLGPVKIKKYGVKILDAIRDAK